ncbi:hypothetical protein [Hymenobacter yonginensis]|uniref:Uncharacterized protein n=1 Tax=Hymenobacter yonginensis TaxID=748197 RepID=A0ABY7PSZ8_9BACT|nr:hypothetical protein [Hymenobacter yonginensis]WBO86068.1 hypothetical protein O9Z63_07385 [Hymenobacter yonginensis]
MAGLPQIGIQHTCLSPGPGAELRITLRKTGNFGTEPVTLSVAVLNSQGEQVFADFYAGSSTTFRFSPAPDDTYTITGTDEKHRRAQLYYQLRRAHGRGRHGRARHVRPGCSRRAGAAWHPAAQHRIHAHHYRRLGEGHATRYRRVRA